MILLVTEVVTYMGLWSEVSEDFWRKMKPDVGMPHRWVWNQDWGTEVLHREIAEIALSDQAQALNK